MNRLLVLPVLLLATTLGGCASTGKDSPQQREVLLSAYEGAVRWSDFDAAWGYIDPEVRKSHPLTDLETARFKQIQIVGYTVMHQEPAEDGGLDQSVEIRLINRNTQVERVIVDRQHWVFDPVAKRWWLTTGLPDLDAR